jgi:serine/threonine protein kinase
LEPAAWANPKLNHDVAIKVLPAALSNDADYLARFQREARVLASLNHPNIAGIYVLEDHAIVMELVEGPTLADRISQGPLPLKEALPIARQIAEALEAAHEEGIIHRDLKPSDFGLANTADAHTASNASISPALTIRATEAGLILDTAAYMSPEQAAGVYSLNRLLCCSWWEQLARVV